MSKIGLEFYQDSRQEWRWRIVAANGKIIGASTEGYKEVRDCIQNVRDIVGALVQDAITYAPMLEMPRHEFDDIHLREVEEPKGAVGEPGIGPSLDSPSLPSASSSGPSSSPTSSNS